jgi:hypothetical protein
MMHKKVILTIYSQKHIRKDWYFDLSGDLFKRFLDSLETELSRYGIEFFCQENADITIDVNSYADLLNAVRVSSPMDGVTSRCVGHIIGKSQHLDLLEDIGRAVNRVAFAPETIPPDDHNRKVCHNCGCGC